MNWFWRLIVFVGVLLSLSHEVQAKLHYFRTTSESYSQLEGQLEILNRYGVHVRHVFPPNQIIVDHENGIDINRVRKDFVVQSVGEDEILYMSPDCEIDQVLCAFRFMCLIPFASMPLIGSVESNCEGEAPPALGPFRL